MISSLLKLSQRLTLGLFVSFCVFSAASAQNDPRSRLEQFAAERASQYAAERTSARARALSEGLPLRRVFSDGTVMELQRFDGDRPIYYITTNANAADTVSTDEVQPGGGAGLSLDGMGRTLGIWDGGNVRDTHQEFGGRVVNQEPAALSDHSTHVAGTMIASGVDPAARGMAFEGQLRSWDFNGDAGEMATQQLATDPVRVSNHSYGLVTGWRFNFFGDFLWAWLGDVAISITEDAGFGLYDQNSADWDEVAFDAPYYLIVSSAGNDRSDSGPAPGSLHWHVDGGFFQLSSDSHPADGGADGYDSLGGGGGMAKNILSVGAVEDIFGGYTAPSDVVMSSFSGWGPTDDGRIKPDIVANGVSLFSSLSASDIDYGSFSGTSMSSPNVAGSVALLQQHADELNGAEFRASTYRALILHTADEAGTESGPDYRNGWGLLNTDVAASVLSEDATAGGASNVVEINLVSGTSSSLSYESDGTGPLRTTIAWTDPPGTPPLTTVDPTDLMVVNDVDLRVTGPGAVTFEPWILDPANPAAPATTGDNFRDNVEQVLIATPVAGTYTVEISHKGTLQGGSQWVSLIVTGNSDTGTPVPPTITSTPSTNATVGQAYSYDADDTVDASGTPQITFSLVSGPAGFSVASNGLVSWTPAAGQEGFQAVTIQASNSAGTDSQSYTIDVSGAPLVTPTITSTPGTTAMVGQVYSYDADNTVEATGTEPITFSLVSGPAGFNVAADGLVTWTPAAGQEGPQSVTIQADNSVGTDAQSYTIDVSPAPVLTFRINAGGGAYTDANGDEFEADRAFAAGDFGFVGGTSGLIPTPVAGTTDDLLYQEVRYGSSFSYQFDGLPAGNYQVTMYLSEPAAGGGVLMDVSAEGVLELDDYDVAATAGGTDTAYQQILAVTVTDGLLNLDFDVVAGLGAFVSAIAVVQSAPPVPEPDISVTPASVDFDQVTTGSNQDRIVTVINNGTADLMVQSLDVTPGDFSVVGPAVPFALGPGGSSADVTVRFSPSSDGVQNGNLEIVSDDPDETIVNVALSGEGITAPAMTSTPNTNATVGQAYSYDADNTVEATGTAPITFSLVSGPSGFSVSSSGLVSWTPVVGQEGPQAVTIQASNAAGTDAQSYTIDVSGQPPAITSTPNTTATVGQAYSYDEDDTLAASGSPTITFSLVSGPTGFSVSSGGLVVWTPAAGQEGPQAVIIQASNDAGTDTQSYTIDVSAASVPPMITSSPNTAAAVGQAYAYDTDDTVEASGTAPITFSLVSGPTGFSVSGGGLVTWTPTAGQEGPQAVTIQASNAAGTDTQSFTINVSGQPPTITSTPNTTATVGQAYIYDADNTVEATGTSPIDFSLVSGPAGLSVSGGGLVSWIPAAGQEGPQEVTIRASNSAGTDTQSYVVDVSAAPLLTFRINAGGGAYADLSGDEFEADRAFVPGDFGFTGGTSGLIPTPVAGTADDLLYQQVRYGGGFSYQFDGLPAGDYQVTLYVSEPTAGGGVVMGVSAEGSLVLSNYDVAAAAGGTDTAHQEVLLVNVLDGQLNLDFDVVAGLGAFVAAIAVEQQ